MDISAIILAGGKGSRLGRSKAMETIEGKSLIQWVIDRLATISTEIIIATAQGDCFDSLVTKYPLSTTIKEVADVYPGKGPLSGIHSALKAALSSHAIVVGCDTPFLSVTLLDYMARAASAFDVAVPRIENRVEPLCAIYSRNCIAPIQSLLESNELQISKPTVRKRIKQLVTTGYLQEKHVGRQKNLELTIKGFNFFKEE